MTNETLILIGIVSAVAGVVYCLSRYFMGDSDKAMRERLASNTIATAVDVAPMRGFESLVTRLGSAAAKPFLPKTREKQSDLRQKLAMAGIYSPSAYRTMTGAKVICLGLGLLGGYIVSLSSSGLMLPLAVGGLVGYLGPTFWLRMKLKKNQENLNHGLPDALDLMVVCVEAGLTVDAAMQRVGSELAIAHPTVSREFGIAHMETRVGLSRTESLKNLGVRTGNASLQSLASMLVQAERFGTSIGTALRIHADTMRANRQHKAEEMAAKASVKMSFPLVLFIFPSTFIVLAGPTVVQVMSSDLMK